MKNKYRNLFLAFGVVAVAIMMFTFDMDYQELWANLKRAGYYFPLILLLWAFVYLINTLAWHQIIGPEHNNHLSYARLYKLTITGFALNYVTPGGLMGGEPYRIMELKPYVGVERATSSVILYVMMHIFSHFVFWIASVIIFVLRYPPGLLVGSIMGLIMLFCAFFVVLFIRGYKSGMAVAFVRICGRLPFLKKRAIAFANKHADALQRIDAQIALLHRRRKRTFYAALSLEFAGRVISCLEIFLILNILSSNVSFIDCILIAAFSSLFANMLFFIPMQLGGREGGFALAVGGLSMSGAYGVYTALITRLREMVWIVIGLALIKVGNKR